MKRAIALLLAMAVIGFAHSTEMLDSLELSYADSLKAEQLALDTQIDYDGLYTNLIHQEEEHFKRNSRNCTISALLIGFGGGMAATLLHEVDFDEQNTLKESLGMEMLIVSLGLTTIGVIGISYNLYDAFNSNGSYYKRDAYKRAYEIYKRRRSEQHASAKLTLTPSLNLANSSAGMNLSLQF